MVVTHPDTEPFMLENSSPLGRRAFVKSGALLLCFGATADLAAALVAKPRLRIGLVTDLHYADKPANGTRHYRDTLAKLAEAAERFQTDKPDFVVELGDFIDAADSPATELAYLRRVNEVFRTIPGPKHCVLGNHCVETLTKREFLDGVGQRESFYSFDAGGFHFVVLDACFRADGAPYGRNNSVWSDANIPPHELEWLRDDLKATTKPTIVFAHQRLDEAGKHAVRNAAEVRKLLEASGRVTAVLQGHSHKNDHQEINGIHYTTLVAMVEGPGSESSGYSTLDILADDTLRLTGFRNQANYEWK